MAVYLTFDLFKKHSVLPEGFANKVERDTPGFVDTQLDTWSRWIDARLRKRYASPFNAFDGVPDVTPPQIQLWLAALVTIPVWIKRGVDPGDLQFDLVLEDRNTAKAEILEAANSDNSWFDLPLKVSEDGTLISRPSTRFRSEQSPFVFTDRQFEIGISEDENGIGSSG